MDLQTAVTHHENAAVISLSGELDMQSTGRLRALLAEQLLAGPGNLVLDMSGLAFIDSTGLAALIAADKGTRRAGMSMVLAAPVPAVRRVMILTGIDVVLTTVDTVDEALARLVPER